MDRPENAGNVQSFDELTKTNAGRRRTSQLLVAYVFVASILFVLLTLRVSRVPDLDFDLTISRAMQSFANPTLDVLMQWVGYPGYFPQVIVLNGLIILFLYLKRLRWEALCILTEGLGIGILGTVLRMTINRPRPSPSLVHVVNTIENGRYGFPSGHAMGFLAIFGFLCFLTLVLLKPSLPRTLLMAAIIVWIALVGISRIYVGEHWPSDVLGGYLFGSIWLAAIILFYQWGKPRGFVDSSVYHQKDV